MDKYGGKMMGILVEDAEERGNGEGHNGGV